MTSSDQDTKILVIGAGCGRTGTASLKVALERIYQRPCYHMFELLKNHREHALKWVELDKQVTESMLPGGKPVDAQLIRDMLQGYGAVVDFPAATYYRQLMEVFPDAKVILTVRDTQKWIRSARNTIFREEPWYLRVLGFFGSIQGWKEMTQRFMARTFEWNTVHPDDKTLGAAFEKWNAEVQKQVPKDRLLVFQVQEGWEPLCRFLGVDIPQEPFPRVNDYEEFKQHLRSRRISSMKKAIPLAIGILAAGIGIVFYFQRH